jgi:hypothetical protein
LPGLLIVPFVIHKFMMEISNRHNFLNMVPQYGLCTQMGRSWTGMAVPRDLSNRIWIAHDGTLPQSLSDVPQGGDFFRPV